MVADFYDVLGVDRDADEEALRRAFRERASRYHPDVNDHPRARDQFTVLNKARDVLTDPVERRAYDRLGHHVYVRERLESSLPAVEMDPRPADDAEPADIGDLSGDDGEGIDPTARPPDDFRGRRDPTAGRPGPTDGGSAGADADGSAGADAGGSARADAGESTRTDTGGATRADADGGSTRSAAAGSNSRTDATTADGTNAARTAASGGNAHTSTPGANAGASGGAGTAGVNARASGGAGTGGTNAGATNGAGRRSHTWQAARRRQATRDDGTTHLTASYRWLAVVPVATVYAFGLLQYLLANRPGLARLAAYATGGAGPGMLAGALHAGRFGIATPLSFVHGSGIAVRPLTAGTVLLSGIVLLPLVLAVAVWGLRRDTTWRPSYLHALAALGPAAGLGLSYVGGHFPGVVPLSTIPLWVDALLFVALPGLAVVSFLLNRFVLVMPLKPRRW